MDRAQLLNYVTHLQNHTIPDIQREVAKKEETIKRMKCSAKRTYEDNDRLINERNALENEVDRLKKAYVKLNDELTTSIRSREKQVAELVVKNERLEKRVEELVKELNTLSDDNKKLEIAKWDLKDEREIFKERIRYLESNDVYKEYQNRVDELIKDNNKLKKRVEELVKNSNNLGNDVDILTVENKDLKRRVDELVMKNDELEDEKQELDEKCADLLTELDNSDRRCINLTYENSDLKRCNNELTNRINEIVKKNIDVSGEITKKLRKIKNALNSLYGKPSECDSSHDDYNTYAKHIAAKIKALEDAGLSHDDAMSLIPLWDDEVYE
jgi:chromosome segregation ATPase